MGSWVFFSLLKGVDSRLSAEKYVGAWLHLSTAGVKLQESVKEENFEKLITQRWNLVNSGRLNLPNSTTQHCTRNSHFLKIKCNVHDFLFVELIMHLYYNYCCFLLEQWKVFFIFKQVFGYQLKQAQCTLRVL